MIRIVTLHPIDPADLAELRKTLFATFGVGVEHLGERPLPRALAGAKVPTDVLRLLAEVEPIRLVGHDKVLYLTALELEEPEGPLGAPPVWGFAEYGAARSVVSLAHLPPRGVSEASIETWRRRLAREAAHVVGHLWDLHHCYDARCAMHPSWSPHLGPTPDASLCTFCREKSEARIRLATS